MAPSCTYCSKEEPLPYKCTLCSKHFCSAHREPQSHQCTLYTDSPEQVLSEISWERKKSHEGLPYSLYGSGDAHFFAGGLGSAVIAMQLKKSGWNLRLQKGGGTLKDILADRDEERWYVRIKTADAKLVELLRAIPISAEELQQLETASAQENALPVIALVASDSAVLLSAKTFQTLSP